MGFTSWRSCVTGRSILVHSCATVLFPNGTPFTGLYDGYGRLDDVDLYLLHSANYDLAEARRLTSRLTGNPDIEARRTCALSTSELPNNGLRVLRASEYRRSMRFDDFAPSSSCPNQGYFFETNREEDAVIEDFKPGFVFSRDGLTVRHGRLIVEFTTESNESLHGGDYDETDPEDQAAYRFYSYAAEKNDPTSLALGQELEDGSYCTATPADTPADVTRQLLKLLAGKLYEDATFVTNANGNSTITIPKRALEAASWIAPAWLEKTTSAA
jgi:hypothetical protein